MSPRRVALVASAALAAPVLLVACAGGAATPHLGVKGEVTPVNQRVPGPPLAGQRIDGGTFDVATARGSVVVVNAFGSWCGPCKTETPALQSVYDATKARGVQFVGLAVRDTVPKLQAFVQRYGVTYPVVQDADGGILARVPGLAEVNGPPNTLVLDRRGRVAARWVGPVLGSQLRAAVEAVAAEPA